MCGLVKELQKYHDAVKETEGLKVRKINKKIRKRKERRKREKKKKKK